MPVWPIVALATVGVGLTVVGPKILGHATDLVIQGVQSPSGIDFGELHMVLLGALALFLASSGLTYVSAYLMAGIIQRTMPRLRAEVEDKLHRLPLVLRRRPAAGRPAQPGHQRHRQHRPEPAADAQPARVAVAHAGRRAGDDDLDLAAARARRASCRSRSRCSPCARSPSGRKARFIAQWRHTGALNAQVEEAFTGHAIVKAFGRQREVEARSSATRTTSCTRPASAPSSSRASSSRR